MKGFRFRLDSVLRVREYEAEQARVALARARNFAVASRAAAGEAHDRARVAGRALVDRLSAGASVPELEIARRGLHHLRAEAVRAEALAAEAEARVPPARRAVVEARSRRRALEILRERAEERARKEAERLDQARLDEIAVQRFGRSHG